MRFATQMALWTAGTMAMAVAAGAASPISVSDVQKSLADGDNAAAIAGCTRLLAATGTAAASVDKGQVYAIKAEAHLRSKQFGPAADAFGHAAKVATESSAADMDLAMATLVKRSSGGAYVPHKAGADGAKPSPIDIAATENRKAALEALFADESATDSAKVKLAGTTTSVPAIVSAAPSAALMRDFEVAATDGSEESKPLIEALVKNARDLLSKPLQPASETVDKYKAAANAPARYGRTAVTGANGGDSEQRMKVGLSQSQRSDLQGIVTMSQQVLAAAQAIDKALAEPNGKPAESSASGTPADDNGGGGAAADGTAKDAASKDSSAGGDLASVETEAKKVGTAAQELLNTDFGHPGAMTGNGGNGYGGYGGNGTRGGGGGRRG